MADASSSSEWSVPSEDQCRHVVFDASFSSFGIGCAVPRHFPRRLHLPRFRLVPLADWKPEILPFQNLAFVIHRRSSGQENHPLSSHWQNENAMEKAMPLQTILTS